jgi:peptidoglycan/LPS O-acetylase OafA/YrhL
METMRDDETAEARSAGTKPVGSRYAFLDGIRGLAAIFVLNRHTGDFWGFLFYRSYLAVDLFFILSGFVISYAYDEKLRNGVITLKDFVLIRLIRLYPVYFLSFVLCAIILFGKFYIRHDYSTADFLTIFLLTSIMIPSGIGAGVLLFPVNIPYWSLFYELIVNFIYAAVRPVLSTPVLALVVTVFGLLIALSAVHHGHLDIGYAGGFTSMATGFSKAAFGIFLGILTHRNIGFLRNYVEKRYSPWLALVIISLVLASPSFENFNGLIDVFVVLVVFPLCVIFASQARRTKADGLLLALGSASYPVYVFHMPVGQIVSFSSQGLVADLAPYSGVILVLVLVPATILLEKVYDIPVRRWLTRKAFNR